MEERRWRTRGGEEVEVEEERRWRRGEEMRRDERGVEVPVEDKGRWRREGWR